VIYSLTGLYFRINLGLGIAALTLGLIAFFVAQGVIDIFGFFRSRRPVLPAGGLSMASLR
jgi:uncharacterized membrane protein HdeD (DUF308 family)